ncbi:DNA-binding protein [Cryobacterium sp. TmT2-59]|nr:DNA-binding protein [Cryobacterium sp. TmT2-59]
MPEPWSSADDIAGHLGVTKVTVSSRIAEKHVPAGKIGRGAADSGSNGAGD